MLQVDLAEIAAAECGFLGLKAPRNHDKAKAMARCLAPPSLQFTDAQWNHSSDMVRPLKTPCRRRVRGPRAAGHETKRLLLGTHSQHTVRGAAPRALFPPRPRLLGVVRHGDHLCASGGPSVLSAQHLWGPAALTPAAPVVSLRRPLRAAS